MIACIVKIYVYYSSFKEVYNLFHFNIILNKTVCPILSLT
jgi:hypothetical protein